MGVSLSSAAAAQEDELSPSLGQVRNGITGLLDHGCTVPGGTGIDRRPLPSLPCIFWPAPRPPSSALKIRLSLRWERVFRFDLTIKITSPPLPPSPPSGPPRGTNFSLRKDTAPSPPLAGRDDDRCLIHEAVHVVSVLDGLDGDEVPSLLVMENNISVHEREQGVVAAPPHQRPQGGTWSPSAGR